MNKQERFKKLAQKIKKQDLPFKKESTNLVLGRGNLDAQILFLGEAPGKNEDLEGKPFVGSAGKFLNNLLESVGLSEDDIFISNVVFYRPPKNRQPRPKELAEFTPFIDQIIKLVDPGIIVTLGRTPLSKFLPNKKVSEIHGKVQKIVWNNKQIYVLPLYHPAAALYVRNLKPTLEKDFKQIKKII